MNLKLEFEFSKADVLKEVDDLKKEIDDMRPLPADVEGRVMQNLRLDWNYNSNAIEGNKLSYGETVAFLMEGITAKGKPLKDHLDIRGHNEAINFLLEIVKDARPLSETDIRSLHEMILVEPYDSPAKTAEGQSTVKRITLGEYKTSPNHVKTSTGEIHYYATPEETPAKMQELMEWLEEVEKYDEIHPVVIASLFHHKFVAIHPFDDGNGRLSRILMNLILMQKGYPPVVVKMDDRKNYYSLLSRADNGDSWPFVEYVAEQELKSLRLYVKAANNEDIEDDDDIDKEIALFKQSLNIDKSQILSSREGFNFYNEKIVPLITIVIKKIGGFEDLFFRKRYQLTINFFDILRETTGVFETSNIQSEAFQYHEEFKITSIVLYLSFMIFKHKDQDKFDVDTFLNIEFMDKEFILKVSGQVVLRKEYHQGISKSDGKIITKKVVDHIKTSIEQFNAF